MDVRQGLARSGRVLLVVALVVIGVAYARDAYMGLRDHGRDGAALAFMQCIVAVSSWALGAGLWRWTARRRRTETAAVLRDAPPPAQPVSAPPPDETRPGS